MKAGWYEKKLQTRWYVYQSEKEKIRHIEEINVLTQIIERNKEDWEALEATNHTIRFNDIPWLNNKLFVLKDKSFDKYQRRALLLRWHPDRFFTSKIWSRIYEEDKEKVKENVLELCKLLVDITSS
jgi:hypothetical protein